VTTQVATQRGGRCIEPDEVETQVFDWGTIKWLAEPRTAGAETRFSTGVVVLAPGKGHTRHNHPGVEEILYVVAGEGEQMVEDADGRPVRQRVRPGVLVHIPPDVYHETINTGWKPLELLAVYCPAGPEALLRGQADRVLAPGQQA
jgi:oxalate decarboxylase/phosphoglucose isomerase-like protein (cupin superfamily)